MEQENKNRLANDVVQHMMEHDSFSQWLGIEVLEIKEGYSRITMLLRDEMLNGFGIVHGGYSRITMLLRDEMLNGFGIVHGGIAFSLADSAFAFACNNRNNISMALDTSITFTKALKPGMRITAEAKELHNGRSTGLYLVTVTNENQQQVALFKGTCFRSGKSFDLG
jgi:acyl-CoA thioesterase